MNGREPRFAVPAGAAFTVEFPLSTASGHLHGRLVPRASGALGCAEGAQPEWFGISLRGPSNTRQGHAALQGLNRTLSGASY